MTPPPNTDLWRAAGAAEKLGRKYDLQEDSITIFFTPVKCKVRDVEIPEMTPYLHSTDGVLWFVGADNGLDGPQTQSLVPLSGTKLTMAILGMCEFANMPLTVYHELREYLFTLSTYKFH